MTRFLFEKLVTRPTATGSQKERLREAVLRQLEWLVSSREWLAEQKGVYLIETGMPDVVSLSATPEQANRYAKRLRQLIMRHEPRLLDVEVELHATGRWLSPFRITVNARLDSGEADTWIRFDSGATS